MARWIKIAEVGAIAPGAGNAFEVEGFSIAVFNVNGAPYAIDDSCPHQGSSLAAGRLEGYVVTCRSHGMKVNVTAGQQPSPGMIVRSFPLESGLSDGKEKKKWPQIRRFCTFQKPFPKKRRNFCAI
jgi:3-phenylpropionate/trans-cinnamate dioxygenase ferredoxin subunit